MLKKNFNNNLNIRLKNGQSEAYHELYKLYYSSFYKYALKLTYDNQQAKDLVQDALIRLWQKKELIIENKPVNQYVFQIIRNLFFDLKSKDQKKNDSLALLIQETVTEFVDYNDTKVMQLQRVEEEIEKLPIKSRTIFKLNKRRGLNYKEIGEMLNISEKTVESHVYRAMQKLRAELS